MNLLLLNMQMLGISQMLLALVHLIFETYFDWKKELAPLSLINRQLMYVHTFFVAFIVFLNGLLSFFAAKHLIEPSPLAAYMVVGLSIFWLVRLYSQFFVYKRELWLGKRFETTIHILFSVVWVWYSLSYLTLVWLQLR